jgi:hypothetical protein
MKKLLTGEFREFVDKSGEWNGTVNSDDSGVATDITELIVGGTREDFAAETTHEADTWRCVVEVIGAGGGGDGIVV